MTDERIRVFLADDNLIVREGVRSLLELEPDLEVVGAATDYDELVSGVDATVPQVVVTDIRMPPRYESEGIDAAREVRKRHPGTGIVVLSQFDDPDYAVTLLNEGAAGYAYLLKDRVAEGNQLTRAVREVATGGSMLDPRIVELLVQPVSGKGDLSTSEEDLLRLVAEGRTVKSIAALQNTTPEAVTSDVDQLFLKLAEGATAGEESAMRRLRMLYQAMVDLKEQGDTLSRFVPGGLAEQLLEEGREIGETENLEVTVLMSDIRGYSTIAETATPSRLAIQLNEHRAEMNHAILGNGGTVMQFVGDAVMAVFGAPVSQSNHAQRAVSAAMEMQAAQRKTNERWASEGLPAFPLGVGISTGEVAAAMLGSEERLEYSVVGDTVNLAQRIQEWAGPGEIVMTAATYQALESDIGAEQLPPGQVKGRTGRVDAYRIPVE